MAKLLDTLYNRVIEGELLEITDEEVAKLGLAKASELPALSDAINLGTLQVGESDVEGVYLASFVKELTEAEYNKIKSDGLFILMFNTSCVIIPYTKQYPNRFTVNAIYNADGESMVVRGKLTITADEIYSIAVEFDSTFAGLLAEVPALRPYGIVKFLSI